MVYLQFNIFLSRCSELHVYFKSLKFTFAIFILKVRHLSLSWQFIFSFNSSTVTFHYSRDVYFFSKERKKEDGRCVLCPKVLVVKIIALWGLKKHRKPWPRCWLVEDRNLSSAEHPHVFITGFDPAGLVGIWRHYAGHCCTAGWVTQCSREELAPLSLLLALARDLHIFLLEALKEYKKRLIHYWKSLLQD